MDLRVKAHKGYNLFISGAIIIVMGLIICTNLFHYCYKMNSDIASEAVLARLIWESREWIPKSWYPSSELRICSAPNLAALFYGIVHNLALAMGMACIAMSLGILITGYFFISQFSFNKTQQLVFLLLCLIMPNHIVTLELFYLFGSYYAVHVMVMFLSLGIYAQLISGKYVHVVWQGLTVILSFVIGMQGVRGLLVLNVPLLATEILRQFYLVYKKTWNKTSMLMVGRFVYSGVIAGYAGTLFPFSIEQDMSRNIRNGFVKFFKTVLPDMKDCLGLSDIESGGRFYILFCC